MSEKVKVSRKFAEALEYAKTKEMWSDNGILVNHNKWGGDLTILNSVSHIQMAQILINGYEIEITPEEKILNDFLIEKNNFKTSEFHESKAISHGYTLGVRNTLNTLGIKIKGIN